VGEVTAATLRSAARDATDAGSARAVVRVSGRFPSCAGPPLGLLGRGDVTTGFALTRFQPLAVARQDEACGAKKVARTADLEAVVRLPRGADRARITVGTTALEVAVAAPAAASGPAR